jgi:hypothetical protein
MVSILIAIAGLAIWAQSWTIRQPERPFFKPVEVTRWLRAEGQTFGPLVRSFAGPPTPQGLEVAAREQRAIVQSMELEGANIWSTSSCTWWDVGGLSAGDMDELIAISFDIERFDLSGASVSIRYAHPSLPYREVVQSSRTETWVYRGSWWLNTTCQYQDGPRVLSPEGLERPVSPVTPE